MPYAAVTVEWDGGGASTTGYCRASEELRYPRCVRVNDVSGVFYLCGDEFILCVSEGFGLWSILSGLCWSLVGLELAGGLLVLSSSVGIRSGLDFLVIYTPIYYGALLLELLLGRRLIPLVVYYAIQLIIHSWDLRY